MRKIILIILILVSGIPLVEASSEGEYVSSISGTTFISSNDEIVMNGEELYFSRSTYNYEEEKRTEYWIGKFNDAYSDYEVIFNLTEYLDIEEYRFKKFDIHEGQGVIYLLIEDAKQNINNIYPLYLLEVEMESGEAGALRELPSGVKEMVRRTMGKFQVSEDSIHFYDSHDLTIYKYNMELKEETIIKIAPNGIEEGGISTEAYAADETGYWIPTSVTNTYKEFDESAVYHFNMTGHQDRVIHMTMGNPNEMEVHSGYIYYIIRTETDDSYKEMYRINMSRAEITEPPQNKAPVNMWSMIITMMVILKIKQSRHERKIKECDN